MSKRSKTRLTVILMILSIMLLCFGLVACGGTKTYKVTLDYDSEQGSVELSPKAEDNKYKEGTELTVTVTPNEGYVLDTFKLSTEDRNATPDNAGKFVFKVEEDTTITVTFKSTTPSAEKYGVTKNAPENGEIEITPAADAEGKYAKDTEITVTLKPAQGYEVDTFTVGSVDKKAELDNNVYKFNITAETEISATFKKSDEEKTTYTVTVSETSNGTITLDPEAEGNKYEENAQVEVTVTPATGYVVDTFTVSTDADAELDGEGKYTLTVTANTTISATFKTEPVAEKYGVTKNTPENGEIEITPAADAEGKYAKDTEITVTLKPAQGYEVDTFTVGGVDKKAELDNNVYKFNITAETEINATFKKSVPAVTAITLNKSSLELMWNYFKKEEEKSVFTLSIASVTPSEISADELEIEWEVDDDTFAEVDVSGKITAKATGATYVTATVKGTGVFAVCTISVTKHEHTLTYAKKDDSQHTATCSVCEYTYDEAHSTHLVSDGASGHHTACEAEGCDYKTETVQHGELVLSNTGEGVNNGFHTMRCPQDCGYYVQEQHRYEPQSSAAEHWNQCKVCSYESTHRTHTLKYRLSDDGTKHVAYCEDSIGGTSFKCNYVGKEEEHSGMEYAQKDGDAEHHYTKCAACEALYNATAHSGTEYAQKAGDADHHYTRCAACETLYNATAHSGTEYAQKDGDADHHYTKCAACETLFNPDAHNLSYTDKDENVHSVKCSVCKKTFADEPHEIDGAACKCGHQVGTHTLVVDENGYTDGSCSCGKENLLFTVDGNGMILTVKADAEHTKIKIPAEIDGKAVKTISAATSSGSMGFRSNTTITDIIVPATIASLPNNAFNGCSSLVSAVILADIAELPQQCFHNCKSLSTLVLSASITAIHKNAFGISSTTIPTTLKTIYYVGTQDAWDALMVKVNTDNGKAKTVLDGVSNVYIYSPTSEAGKWHWKDGAENMIPELWD